MPCIQGRCVVVHDSAEWVVTYTLLCFTNIDILGSKYSQKYFSSSDEPLHYNIFASLSMNSL